MSHATASASPSPSDPVGSLPADLEAYHALFAPLYPRREQAASARRYLRGLLSDEPRKSVERMVLKLQGPDRNAVRSLQQFVGESPWSDAPLLARLWAEVGATLGKEEGVLIVDGSDFRKQGRMSVGVARQWCGELGKWAHCQAGVFVAYAGAQGACLVHRALCTCPVPGPRTRPGQSGAAVAGCRPTSRSGPSRNGRPPCWGRWWPAAACRRAG